MKVSTARGRKVDVSAFGYNYKRKEEGRFEVLTTAGHLLIFAPSAGGPSTIITNPPPAEAKTAKSIKAIKHLEGRGPLGTLVAAANYLYGSGMFERQQGIELQIRTRRGKGRTLGRRNDGSDSAMRGSLAMKFPQEAQVKAGGCNWQVQPSEIINFPAV